MQEETIEHSEPADNSRDAARQAAFWNEARYTALDLTLGRLPSSHRAISCAAAC
jgi:hypothetical protein